ncbi:MAG: PH domain-containing protein [Actinomycetales bacterium]|nr:PH domain-containing protein [Actinomycetales bacterium]
MVRAVPDRTGLRVVNLVHSQELEWAQVVRVSFGGGSPWVVLELSDTEELAVMGIQRADGAFGRAEAARLAALVEHHSR